MGAILSLILVIVVVAAIPFLLSVTLVWATEREDKTPPKLHHGLRALYLTCSAPFLLLLWQSGRGLLHASSFDAVQLLRFLTFIGAALFLLTLAFPGRNATKLLASTALAVSGGVVSPALWFLGGAWRWVAILVAAGTLVWIVKAMHARSLGRATRDDADFVGSSNAFSTDSCSTGGDCSGGD
jgi:hypothetical protein